MADNDSDWDASIADKAKSTRDKVQTKAQDLGHEAAAAMNTAGETVEAKARDLGDTATDKVDDLQQGASSVVDDLRGRAADQVGEARGVVSNMANEAKNKISEIVDQQKTAGADRLASLSRAAQHAAGDLDEQNPQVAKLVRDAASSVDKFAGDLRSSSLSDVVESVTGFARKQPVAFFAASVLAGFVLARFVKSEPAPVVEEMPRRKARR